MRRNFVHLMGYYLYCMRKDRLEGHVVGFVAVEVLGGLEGVGDGLVGFLGLRRRRLQEVASYGLSERRMRKRVGVRIRMRMSIYHYSCLAAGYGHDDVVG